MSTDSPQGPSSLVEQRRLCGIGEPSSPALDLLEAKPPWEGELKTRELKHLRSTLWDVASDLSMLGTRFRETRGIIDNRIMKVNSQAAGMKDYPKLKAALKKMDRLEAELRTLQSEFSSLGSHVK